MQGTTVNSHCFVKMNVKGLLTDQASE